MPQISDPPHSVTGRTPAAALAHALQVDPAKVAQIATSLHRAVHDDHALVDLLRRATEAALRWLPGADVAGIVVRFDRDAFTAAGTDPRVLVVDALQVALDDGPGLLAQRTGTIVSASAAQAGAQWPALAGGAREQGILAFLAAPLAVGGVSRGQLNVYGRGPDGFPPDAEDVVAVLCEHLGRGLADLVAVSTANRQVAGLLEAMAGRAPIEQAKGILMAVHQVDADTAFQLLRVRSQLSNTKLRDVAASFVEAQSTPDRTVPAAGGPEEHAGRGARDVESVFRLSPHGVALADPSGVLLTVNPAMARLLDASGPDALVGTGLAEVLHPGDRAQVRAGLAALGSGGPLTFEQLGRARSADGYWTPVEVFAAAVLDATGAPSHLVVHLSDTTDQVAHAEGLRWQALHDPLTGLANRALFTERLAHGLARHARTGTALSVLFCDVDQFKQVNDVHGHHGGDVVLRAVADRLREGLRPGDTAARLGGDEFALLCEGADDAAAHRITVRLRTALATPVGIGDSAVTVSVSIGVASTRPGHPADAEDLLRAADAAMYRAKRR